MIDDWDFRIKMTPKRTTEYVMVPRQEYDDLIAELSKLRAASRRKGEAGKEYVRGAQNGCRAIELGVVCGVRTYAGHDYCKLHQMRFERTGDPLLTRKRGRKAKA